MTRRDDSLIGQIVAANVVLVAITLFAASLAAGLDLKVSVVDVGFDGLQSSIHQALSMGTSQDYRVAAEEGATYIRVGSVLYGK